MVCLCQLAFSQTQSVTLFLPQSLLCIELVSQFMFALFYNFWLFRKAFALLFCMLLTTGHFLLALAGLLKPGLPVCNLMLNRVHALLGNRNRLADLGFGTHRLVKGKAGILCL